MRCPVCKNEYDLEGIEEHVDECLSAVGKNAIKSPSKSKRSFPFQENREVHSTKKIKISSLPNRSNIGYNNISSNAQKIKMSNKDHVPLAEKMKPCTLDEYVGQAQVVGPNMVLQQLLIKGHIPSMIFWGPPGCGKSSLANVIASLMKEMNKKLHIIKLSAVTCGVASIKEAVNTSKNETKFGNKTIVFMDEIHRFNKLQQDIFLPHVEAGTFTLIGTTTENPSYSLNSALLSRCRVFSLNKLTIFNVATILHRALECINGKVVDIQNKAYDFKSNSEPEFIIDKAVVNWLAEVCDGDARVALNALDLAVKTQTANLNNRLTMISLENIKESLKQVHTLCDKQTNHTHHLYSALHKSIKAGHASASLYWLARIMAIKEDPVDIARRLVRISSEDVGLADHNALGVAVHTMHGCQMIGMPECDVLLGQCVVYLCKAPKSRVVYNALNLAKKVITEHRGPQPSVPLHIRCRSGEGKLQASLGKNKSNLLRLEEGSRSRLPCGLENLDFFAHDFNEQRTF